MKPSTDGSLTALMDGVVVLRTYDQLGAWEFIYSVM